MSEPVKIKLKAKYRHVSNGAYKSVHSDSGHHKRTKIGHAKHVAQFGEPPRKTMIVPAFRGKRRMID